MWYNFRGRRDSSTVGPPKTSIRVPTVRKFSIRIQVVNIFIVSDIIIITIE